MKPATFFTGLTLFVLALGIMSMCPHPAFGAEGPYHSADYNPADCEISLSELLRTIQFYNSLAYHCDPGSEDGYAPGRGSGGCGPADSDYNPRDRTIGLPELLRVIQLYNSDGYHPDPEGEDGFMPGPLGALVSLETEPADADIEIPGHTQQFTVTGTYESGTRQDLTDRAAWSSSDSSVASVSSGLATSVKGGAAVITAASEGMSSSADLTVQAVRGAVYDGTETAFSLERGGASQFLLPVEIGDQTFDLLVDTGSDALLVFEDRIAGTNTEVSTG